VVIHWIGDARFARTCLEFEAMPPAQVGQAKRRLQLHHAVGADNLPRDLGKQAFFAGI
jgi:hypothetical protein